MSNQVLNFFVPNVNLFFFLLQPALLHAEKYH